MIGDFDQEFLTQYYHLRLNDVFGANAKMKP